MTYQCAVLKLGDAMLPRLSRIFFGLGLCLWLAGASRVGAQALNTNLLVNPGAEDSAGAADFTTTLAPSGWTTTANMTAVQYGFGGTDDLNAADSSAISGGANYFAGGYNSPSTTASQIINLAGQARSIDAGALKAVLSGYLGGYLLQEDNVTLTAAFRDAAGSQLGSFTIGPVLSADRGGTTQLLFRQNAALIPAGTRSAVVTLLATRSAGNYSDAYADNLSFVIAPKGGGTPASGQFYWTNLGNSNAYGWGSFNWDGVSLSASTTQLSAIGGLLLDASLAVGADGNIYSGRAGNMTQINPATGAVRTVASGVNNNVTSTDPARTTVFGGWKDAAIATLATGNAFAAGVAHSLSGSDTVAAGLAWERNGTVWYTTGGEDRLGNVGRIDLATYKTTRVLGPISATTITYDPFTGHIFTAGFNGIAQINPATNTVVSTWLNPQGTGQFIVNLEATGKGQLLAFDSNGLLRIWDFSSGSALIGASDTIQASAGTNLLSAGLALANVPTTLAITSPLDVQATVGQPFVYTLETNAATKSYGASSLPPGLTIDIVPRAITGTATTAGVYRVPLTASNAFGSASATLVIRVVAAPPGPRIISGSSATARPGQPFRLQVVATGGSGGTKIAATGLPAGLTIDSVTGIISGKPALEGSSAVTLTATDNKQNSSTATLQITVSSDPTLPVIVSSDETLVTPGQAFRYTIKAPAGTDAGDPTRYYVVGALPQGLGFDPTTATISGIPNGTLASAANAAAEVSPDASGPSPSPAPLSGGVITNVQLFASNSRGTGTLPLVFYLAPSGVVNIATRLSIGTQENVLIGGFIITGNAPKKVIIRGMGPSLKSGGVALPGTVQDPMLELREGNNLLGSNDDWRATQEQEIIDTGVPPPDDRESALIAILNPGAYTAVVSGKGQTTGIGLVELYDLGTASLDTASNSKLANISTRGFVQRADDVMIGGFIVTGGASRVIVRAIGPSLPPPVVGALPDTTLELYNGNGTQIAANDDWRIGAQEQQIKDTTVPPTDDREAAIVATLNPGAYTAIVRGKDSTTGVALVEVYVLP